MNFSPFSKTFDKPVTVYICLHKNHSIIYNITRIEFMTKKLVTFYEQKNKLQVLVAAYNGNYQFSVRSQDDKRS